jgi:formylglycine-generating enzyme required for sulfatase activity
MLKATDSTRLHQAKGHAMGEKIGVFVSHHHSTDEDAFTARLVADLREADADVWVDTAGIPSGSFVAKISEGLAGRQWVVLVMTPAALASPWVRAEVEAGLNEFHSNRMLGVIPLVMQPCQEQDIPPLWRTLVRYDASRDYVSARDGLLGALGLRLPNPQSTLSTRPPESVNLTDLFPPRLVQLGGFTPYLAGETGYILPPLCDVPAGAFLMGSDPTKDKDAQDDEKPQHSVTLAAYQISKYPVTVAEYACFLRAGHTEPRQWQRQSRDLDHPVYVSWKDAVAYAHWLHERTSQPWRLASEAEWEKAARGTDGRIYPWGDKFDRRRANTSEGKKGTIMPVGSYPSGTSPYGAQDMAGNLGEWTSSLFKPYPYIGTDGREQGESTDNRVMRGGSVSADATYARAARRTHIGHSAPTLGSSLFSAAISAMFDVDIDDPWASFRLARSVPNS